MSITLTGITTGALQQSLQQSSANVQAAIAGLVGNTDAAQTATDTTAISQSGQLQSQNDGLKQAATNLAQGSSLTQVASDATGQIAGLLQQLNILAEEAQSPALNTTDRASLNQQFQDLAGQLDQIAGNTSFGGQALLDGTLSVSLSGLISGTPSSGDNTDSLSIPNLQTGALFGGQSLSVQTSDAASQSVAAIAAALSTVTGVQSSIGAFAQTLELAGANVDTALNNQEAAQSNIGESDFTQAATQFSTASVQQNAAIAVAAQGNQLTPALLSLIGA